MSTTTRPSSASQLAHAKDHPASFNTLPYEIGAEIIKYYVWQPLPAQEEVGTEFFLKRYSQDLWNLELLCNHEILEHLLKTLQKRLKHEEARFQNLEALRESHYNTFFRRRAGRMTGTLDFASATTASSCSFLQSLSAHGWLLSCPVIKQNSVQNGTTSTSTSPRSTLRISLPTYRSGCTGGTGIVGMLRAFSIGIALSCATWLYAWARRIISQLIIRAATAILEVLVASASRRPRHLCLRVDCGGMLCGSIRSNLRKHVRVEHQDVVQALGLLDSPTTHRRPCQTWESIYSKVVSQAYSSPISYASCIAEDVSRFTPHARE